jgi:photosystem II stability/assembly factor-like uncharacterized protein
VKTLRIISCGIVFLWISLLAQNSIGIYPLDADENNSITLKRYRMNASASYQQSAGSQQIPSGKAEIEGGTWKELSVYGGDVNDLAVHPNGDLFAATYSGVYRSTDNGQTWEEVNTQLPTSTATSLAINSSGTLFVGMKEGVFKSTDNGASWVKTSLNVPSSSFTDALIVTADDVLFAGNSSAPGNLFRSTDNANSWTDVSVPPSTAVWQLFSPAPKHILAGTLFSGVYLSTDNGDHWSSTSLTNGITGQFVTNSVGEIFVGTYGLQGDSFGGIYQSADSGATWIKVQNEIENLRIPALAINSNDVLFAGVLDGGDAYRSTDNGATWEKIILGLDLDFGIRLLRVNLNDDVFVGSVGNGVYRSTDGGNFWSAANQGLTGFKISDFTVSQAGDIFVAALPGGIFRSTDHGTSWKKINSGLASPAVYSVEVDSRGDLFTGTLPGMYRSLDNGDTWVEINKGLPLSPANSIVINPDSGFIYIGTRGSGVYYSNNDGDSWKEYNDGLSDPFVSTLTSNANGDPFVGTRSQGIFRWEPESASWTQINTGLPEAPLPLIQSIVVHPQSQQIFAALLFFGVYRSQDNGDIWSITTLPDPYTTSLAVDGQGGIFEGSGFFGIGFSNNVYHSTNGGISWTSIKAGIPTNSPVLTLGVDTLDRLLAGTLSSGVLRWSNTSTSLQNPPNNIADKFELSQNYPNPFNPVTTIKYYLPSRSKVVLKIYDILGKEIRILVDDIQSPGLKSVIWDGTNNQGESVGSGVYIYQIRAGNEIQTKKMTLLK